MITDDPDPDSPGDDGFSLKVHADCKGETLEDGIVEYGVHMSVYSVNDVPVTTPVKIAVPSGIRTLLHLPASDEAGGDSLWFDWVDRAEHGKLLDAQGNLVPAGSEHAGDILYESDSGIFRADSFLCQVTDGPGLSEVTVAKILVVPSSGVSHSARRVPAALPQGIAVVDPSGRARVVAARSLSDGIAPDTRNMPQGVWFYRSPEEPRGLRKVVVP